MESAAGVEERYGFGAVQAVLPDPFPAGVDPSALRLPPVPRARSLEDDEAHHRHYWQSHIWAVLHRYRTAYADPGCTAALRDGYEAVVVEALQLAERVTAQPLSPLESVACHSVLKELTAGVASLESTVAALRGTPLAAGPLRPRSEDGSGTVAVPYERRGNPARRPPVPVSAAAPAATPGSSGPGAASPEPAAARTPVDGVPTGRAPSGVAGQDFFAAPPGSHGREFPLHRRGLRRWRTPSTGPTEDDGPD